jgi:hypothetical protein
MSMAVMTQFPSLTHTHTHTQTDIHTHTLAHTDTHTHTARITNFIYEILTASSLLVF